MVRYVSLQNANVSGDETLKLRASAVLLIHQHKELYYGKTDGYEILTEEEREIMQK